MGNETPVNEAGPTSEDKQWALLSYLVPPLTGLMILFIEDKAKRPFLIYPLVWCYCIYLGIMAYQGKEITVPFLSDWIKEQGWIKEGSD
jgi:hypothetical protein